MAEKWRVAIVFPNGAERKSSCKVFEAWPRTACRLVREGFEGALKKQDAEVDFDFDVLVTSCDEVRNTGTYAQLRVYFGRWNRAKTEITALNRPGEPFTVVVEKR